MNALGLDSRENRVGKAYQSVLGRAVLKGNYGLEICGSTDLRALNINVQGAREA